MVVRKDVTVLARSIFGGDGTDGVVDVAVGAMLDDELPGVQFIGGLPLEIDLGNPCGVPVN